MRAAEAADAEHPALAALREGLEHYFSAAGMAVDLSDAMCVELHRIREIREGIANRIEADLAILDAIDGSADLEADYATIEDAPGGGFRTVGRSSDDEGDTDREGGTDDNGIGDAAGAWEQGHGHDPFAYDFSGWYGLMFGSAR